MHGRADHLEPKNTSLMLLHRQATGSCTYPSNTEVLQSVTRPGTGRKLLQSSGLQLRHLMGVTWTCCS
jgi:hypothetical protein